MIQFIIYFFITGCFLVAYPFYKLTGGKKNLDDFVDSALKGIFG